MRTLIISIFLFSFCSGFTQNKEAKLAIKVAYGLHGGLSNHGSVILNQSLLKLGVNFKKTNKDFYLYILYTYNTNSIHKKIHSELDWPLYKGHYIGLTFERHFLSNGRRFSPYLGISVLSEVATNYKKGLTYDSTFRTNQNPANYPVYIGGSDYYIFHASGFYYSTPFFGTVSLGFDVRLIKNLRLNFSLGYGLQIMRYKYLEWKNDADYRELLKDIPMETRMLHYMNAELGLTYVFPFKNKPNPQ